VRSRGWLLAVMGNAVLIHAAVTMARPMVSYRAVEIGAGPVVVGLLGAAFALLPLALSLWLGRVMDMRGSKPFVCYGGLVIAAASALTIPRSNAGLLLLTTAILGVGHLLALVASQVLIAVRSPGEEAERNFARYTLAVSIGQLLGPLAGGLVAGSQGGLPRSTGAAFLLAAVFGLVGALVVAAWAIPDRDWLRPRRPPQGRGSALGLLRTPGMKPAIFASSTLLASVDVMIVFLPVLGQELGLSPVTVGALLSARAAASMLSRLLMGPLLRLVGSSRRLLLISLYASAVGFVWLAFASRAAALAALLVAVGLTLGVGRVAMIGRRVAMIGRRVAAFMAVERGPAGWARRGPPD
jgi:MFS family permease